MSKKPKKFKEEKIAESYFPVDESDLKHTTEKQEKEKNQQPPKITIEKPYKRTESKEIIEETKTSYEKRKKPVKTKKIEYSPAKINLKKDGYELIITEKPQAALKISSALGKSTKRDSHGVPYYELTKNGKNLVVACTVGHLLTLKQNVTGSYFPIFDISWIPNYIAMKKDFTRKYYKIGRASCRERV